MPRAYSSEFKSRAVDMVLVEGLPIRVVADQLKISTSGLDRWIRQLRGERQITPGKALAGYLSPSAIATLKGVLKSKLRGKSVPFLVEQGFAVVIGPVLELLILDPENPSSKNPPPPRMTYIGRRG